MKDTYWLEFLQAASAIFQAILTIIIAILVQNYTKVSNRNAFEAEMRSVYQELNMEIMRGSDIVQYFSSYDKNIYNFPESSIKNVYYVYFELNVLNAMFNAYNDRIINKRFLAEVAEERLRRLMPHESILQAIIDRAISYTPEFRQYITNQVNLIKKNSPLNPD